MAGEQGAGEADRVADGGAVGAEQVRDQVDGQLQVLAQAGGQDVVGQVGPAGGVRAGGAPAGPAAPVGAENLCHQAIFMNHAPCAVAPLDPELIQVCHAAG